jgi:hypothetical protein
VGGVREMGSQRRGRVSRLEATGVEMREMRER